MSEFIGRKISLISKAGIRYEGVLYTIDPAESTVALSKVKSFGTEERVVERAIGPREEVYEFIIFRASDIQDLVVCEVGREASLLSEDSAIVRAAETSSEERAGECWDWLQAGRPPVTRSGVSLGHQYTHAAPARDSANERSVWGPTSSSVMPGAGGSNNTSGGSAGTSNHHAHLHGHHNKSAAVASSGDGGSASGPRKDAPPSSSSMAPPAAATAAGQQVHPGHFQTTAQTQANQRLKAEARSRLMKPPRNSARDNGGDYDGMNYRGSSQKDYYYYYSQPSHSKQSSRYNNNSNQYYNRRDNYNYSNQHQQYYNYYSYPSGYSANTSSNSAAAAGGASAANVAAVTNNTGTSGSDSSGKLRGFECSAIPGAAADQSNLSSNGPYHNQNQQQRHRGAASNHTGKSSQSAGAGAPNNTSNTTGANGNSHSNSGPTGAGAGAGTGAGKHKKKPARNDPADSDKKEGFKDDYDFETANAMIAQELANLHVSQDNNKKDVGNNESNGAREDGHLSDNSDGGYYDKTKSFFDKISSEMTDRAKGKTVRPMNRKEERKINVETFGVAEANRSHGRNASKWNRNSRYYARSNRGSNQSGTTFRGNAHANDSFKKDLPYKAASRGYMSGGRRPILVDGPGRGDDY